VNKTDLTAEPAVIAHTLGRFFPGVPVVVTSTAQSGGIQDSVPWLQPGRTLALIGMSGVGNPIVDRGARTREDGRGLKGSRLRAANQAQKGAWFEMHVDEVSQSVECLVKRTGCGTEECPHRFGGFEEAVGV
jgi:hypothetical protein